MYRWPLILSALLAAQAVHAAPAREQVCDEQAKFVMLAADLRDAQETPQQVYAQTAQYVVPGMGMSPAWRKRVINGLFFDSRLSAANPSAATLSYRAWCLSDRATMTPLQ